jgi:hypothetical protein
MSPLTIDRIKKAKGHVKIVVLSEDDAIKVSKFAIQILENGAWVNVFVNHDRNICEKTVRKATSQVILG